MNFACDGFTDAQIKAALHGRNGIQKYCFRYELQTGGARVRDLKVTEGTVALDFTDSIQRSATLTVYDSGINWLHNTIKIFMGLWVCGKWVEWSLGVFIPSTPTKIAEHYEVECYDYTVILKEDGFTNRHFIAGGTKYIDAVQSILVSSGIVRVRIINDISTKVPVDREWDIGVCKLDIINTLLEEINYNPIYCDADGNMVISPYIEPYENEILYLYAADEMSVILPEVSTIQDFYAVPNVFIATSSNPDMKQDYRSVYTNDNPTSPLSTVQRGRSIVANYNLDAVASQEELDAYVRKQAFAAIQIYEEIEFTTALMPFHGSGDLLVLDHPSAKGRYQETAWEMDLSGSGQMTHSARRLVRL